MACPAGFCKAEHGQHLNNNATFLSNHETFPFKQWWKLENSTKNFKLPVLTYAALYLQNHFVILY